MDDELIMNRVILVGNGFDLAHDMKTGYNDFILDYIIDIFSNAGNRYNPFVDEAFEISTGDSHYGFPYDGFGSVSDLIKTLYKENKIDDLFKASNFYSGNRSLTNLYKIKIKMPFIEHLVKSCSFANWVDIENEFYDKLKDILVKPSAKGKVHDVTELNMSLRFLIEKLETYLTNLPANRNFNREFEELIPSSIDGKDFSDDKYYSAARIKLGNTLILNFNYTSTIEKYVNTGLRMKDVEVNYIHGQLGHVKNPVIFGFGDELDNDYAKFELDRAKGLFEYIKSFWYFKTSNYYNLIRFIDSDDFQVYVLGHSCGLSDRTMLNMIFEHDRCKSIKIFYHGTKDKNNYTALTQEIARHFKDKRLMRRRIVSFDRSSPMPQAF